MAYLDYEELEKWHDFIIKPIKVKARFINEQSPFWEVNLNGELMKLSEEDFHKMCMSDKGESDFTLVEVEVVNALKVLSQHFMPTSFQDRIIG